MRLRRETDCLRRRWRLICTYAAAMGMSIIGQGHLWDYKDKKNNPLCWLFSYIITIFVDI